MKPLSRISFGITRETSNNRADSHFAVLYGLEELFLYLHVCRSNGNRGTIFVCHRRSISYQPKANEISTRKVVEAFQ